MCHQHRYRIGIIMNTVIGRFDLALLVMVLLISVTWTSSSVAFERFSHDDWTAVLQRFVDDKGFVDYQSLASDRTVFDRYLASVEQMSPVSDPQLFPTKADALAYYINAYNAHVFNGVLERGPEQKSIWRGLISGLNFFVRMAIIVGGEETNLKKLEDRTIREDFKDPRIHAAINCASISCPRLPRIAFEGDTLNDVLDGAMREFVTTPTNVAADAGKSMVMLSEIFDWFESDFLEHEERNGNAGGSVIDYINRYRAADAQIPDNYKVKYLRYDKGINKQ